MTLHNELEGVFVVSLEQAVAAPYCGLLLADAGARVVKVERPDGDFARGYDAGADGQSAIFAWLNRGKSSVCLDLKTPDDLQLLRDMCSQADVVLANLAPGALGRLGLDLDDLRQLNPKLITCSISGYGEDGDGAKKKAYDFLVQGEVGVCSVTGTPDDPARVGVSLSDLSTGLTAFSAILRALIQRARTGQGADLKISMFDVMADWMNMPLLAHRYMGGAPQRSGLKHSFIAPYGAFVCQDGTQVLLSVQSDREFARFCELVLKQPDLADDPKFDTNPQRYANRDALDQIVADVFAQMPACDVIANLDSAQIANARLNSVADLSDHPFLANTTAQIGEATIEMAGLPVATDNGVDRHVPALGEHTAQIRDEFSKKVCP